MANRPISLRTYPHHSRRTSEEVTQMNNQNAEEKKTVTKKDIVRRISTNDSDLTQIKAKEVVQKTLDAIISALSEEPHRIELRNFGVFEVRRRKPRIARNPKTNARVQVPAKNVVTFKPGKEMEELIQKIQAVELDDSEN
jgi:integration host factor subunit beta